MRQQELSGPVQRRNRFVEERVVGLKDVRHLGGDVEGDLHVGGSRLPGQADSLVRWGGARTGAPSPRGKATHGGAALPRPKTLDQANSFTGAGDLPAVDLPAPSAANSPRFRFASASAAGA